MEMVKNILYECDSILCVCCYSTAKSFSVRLILKVFGSPLLGYIMAKLIMFWLSYIFNDGLIEITISLAMTYITFYICKEESQAC